MSTGFRSRYDTRTLNSSSLFIFFVYTGKGGLSVGPDVRVLRSQTFSGTGRDREPHLVPSVVSAYGRPILYLQGLDWGPGHVHLLHGPLVPCTEDVWVRLFRVVQV